MDNKQSSKDLLTEFEKEELWDLIYKKQNEQKESTVEPIQAQPESKDLTFKKKIKNLLLAVADFL